MPIQIIYIHAVKQKKHYRKISTLCGYQAFVWKGAVEKNKEKLETKTEAVLHEIASQIKHDQSALSKDETPRPIDSGELRTRLAALNENVKDIDKPTRKIYYTLQHISNNGRHNHFRRAFKRF